MENLFNLKLVLNPNSCNKMNEKTKQKLNLRLTQRNATGEYDQAIMLTVV